MIIIQMKKFGKILFQLVFTWVLLQSGLHSQSLSNNACDTAKEYIGIKEVRYNSSPIIDEIILNGGGRIGDSWCMFFVYWDYTKASLILKQNNPLQKTGSCARQYKHANNIFTKRLKIIKVNQLGYYKPKKGSIAIFKHGALLKNDVDRYWLGHTGILDEFINADNFVLIEGNTNSGGSRNGDGVFRKLRHKINGNLKLVAFIEVN